MRPSPYAGYDADTRTRMAASDENLRGIVNGRRAAVRKLLATDPRPAQQVYDDTAALLPGDVPSVPSGLAAWVPVPQGTGGGTLTFTGEGPPTPENTAGAQYGDLYLDELTGILYRLTA